MRRILIILNLLFISFLFSCNKNDNSVPAVQGNLLVKVVSKSGSDSVVTEYSYDTGNRLVFEKRTKVTAGVTDRGTVKVLRDNTGMVTRRTEIADYLIASGTDSIVTLYSNAAGRYTSSVMYLTQGGTTVRDTVFYVYDGSGRITRDQHSQYVSSVPFVQQFKQEYVYSSGGNIDSVKQYNFSGGVYSLTSTVAFTYDANVNPLQLQNDADILYHFESFGANNPTKTKSDFVGNPSYNSTTTVVYTYRGDNRPSASVSTKIPSGTVSNETFFYQ